MFTCNQWAAVFNSATFISIHRKDTHDSHQQLTPSCHLRKTQHHDSYMDCLLLIIKTVRDKESNSIQILVILSVMYVSILHTMYYLSGIQYTLTLDSSATSPSMLACPLGGSKGIVVLFQVLSGINVMGNSPPVVFTFINLMLAMARKGKGTGC